MAEQRYVQQYDKIWESSFFACINNKTVCLLCGYQPSVVKKFVIDKHYKSKHVKDYAKYVDQEKFNLIEALKLVYKESRNESSDSDNDTLSSKKATIASYSISHLISKHSKPFTEGEFVKECLIEAVKSFGNSLTLSEAISIPLSKNTVASRINHIASSIEEKLKSLLETCSYFFLCLDESTDN